MSISSSSTSREGLERLAVYGIVRGRARQEVRREQHLLSRRSQNDLALRIPIHVTLRGPFWGLRPEVDSALRQIESLRLGLPIPIVLESPSLTEKAIVWRTVAQVLGGSLLLSQLHRALTSLLRPCVTQDDVLPGHQQEGFLPHVTLGWGVTLDLWKSVSKAPLHLIETQISGLALARYPDTWPESGRVAIQEIPC